MCVSGVTLANVGGLTLPEGATIGGWNPNPACMSTGATQRGKTGAGLGWQGWVEGGGDAAWCAVCGVRFANAEARGRHLEELARPEERSALRCEVSGRTFATAYAYHTYQQQQQQQQQLDSGKSCPPLPPHTPTM